jgi:hypothetical protein
VQLSKVAFVSQQLSFEPEQISTSLAQLPQWLELLIQAWANRRLAQPLGGGLGGLAVALGFERIGVQR